MPAGEERFQSYRYTCPGLFPFPQPKIEPGSTPINFAKVEKKALPASKVSPPQKPKAPVQVPVTKKEKPAKTSKPQTSDDSPPSLGRGGAKHTYLQNLIKRNKWKTSAR